jgi:hypothetical protein
MNDREKTQEIIDDLSCVMDRKTYQHFLIEYDRLCKVNEVGRMEI